LRTSWQPGKEIFSRFCNPQVYYGFLNSLPLDPLLG